MGQALDLTGQRFGKLVALYPTEKRDKSGSVYWMFRCDCGKLKNANSGSVKRGLIKSCGCMNKPHGMTGTRIFNIWVAMRQRCKNDGKPEHNKWGNRGIKVCEEWSDFITFKDWAFSNGYQDNLTIDRIDNNKGYNPDNCRWATYKEQALNTRKNHYITMNGERHTVKQWCDILKVVTPSTVYRRVRIYGWSFKKALTTPKQKPYKSK